MPTPRHYETLGLARNAGAEDVRKAFRRLALKHHPDRDPSPQAAAKFAKIMEAYETLKDPIRRRDYDELLRAEEAPRPARPKPAAPPEVRPSAPVDEIARMAVLFSRGQFEQAASAARKVLERNPREARAYALLGDIARSRGDQNEAIRQYAFAVQMDPRNAVYQQRYEELVGGVRGVAPLGPGTGGVMPAATTLGVSILACVYLAVSREAPLFAGIPLVSSWTLGLLGMLLVVGLTVGVSLALGGQLDRLDSLGASSGRISPTVALASVALVNFWLATALYLILGFTQRAFNPSTTKLVLGVTGGLVLITLGAMVSANLNAGQVVLWGGNLAYLSAICGWLVTDSLRGAGR